MTTALPIVVSFKRGLQILNVSRAAAYRLMKDPKSDFPRPFRTGGRNAYLEETIAAYLRRKAYEAQPVSANAAAAPRLDRASLEVRAA